MPRKRVAILISGRGSNMAALIEAAQGHGLSRRNRARHFKPAGCGRARIRRQAPASPPRSSITRRSQAARPSNARCRRRSNAHRIEIVCLAGFMRLLTPRPFVAHGADRMLNIHPSLLPTFKGLDTHARALAAGVKMHGCTVHFVAPEMDSGPIIVQGAVAVLAGDTARDARRPRARGRAPDLSGGASDWWRRDKCSVRDGRCRHR